VGRVRLVAIGLRMAVVKDLFTLSSDAMALLLFWVLWWSVERFEACFGFNPCCALLDLVVVCCAYWGGVLGLFGIVRYFY
jgi:hypothetical protein